MKFIRLLVLISLTSVNLYAQNHKNEIAIQSDNDGYLGQGSDRYYTNGIFIYYRHAIKVKSGDSATLANKVLGFEAGQKLFNPRTGQIPSSIYVDRPFAAYLYVGSTLNLLYKNESNLKLGAQLGFVGPMALGRPIQNFIHHTFGFYRIEGWEYQIKNDVELNLSGQYNRLLARGKIADISLTTYANLGNGFTGAGFGPLIRIGTFNQLFNSESTQSTVTQNNGLSTLHNHELFFYYKPLFNYVAYDATVQGGLLEDHNQLHSLEVTKHIEPILFSQQIGVAFAHKRFSFNVSGIFQTKDVKEMLRAHQWASLTGMYRFN